MEKMFSFKKKSLEEKKLELALLKEKNKHNDYETGLNEQIAKEKAKQFKRSKAGRLLSGLKANVDILKEKNKERNEKMFSQEEKAIKKKAEYDSISPLLRD